MFKKPLAWILTLALLLSGLSSLTLVSFAEDSTSAFAYASYISGTAMYKNAAQNYYSNGAYSTDMAPITGRDADRYAVYMANQNTLLGIQVPASLGLGSNVTVEIRFRGHDANREETRLAMQYTTAPGQDTDYAKMIMAGAQGAEALQVDTTEIKMASDATITNATEDGQWRVFKAELTNADYSDGGVFNLLKWGHGDDAGDGIDGWYIESILLYDTAKGRPSEEALYIRENTVGYIDFADEDSELLSYTGGEAVDDFQGAKALKIDSSFTVTAYDVEHPAVMASDKNVSVLLEAYAVNNVAGYPSNTWCVMRHDLTDSNTTAFPIGALFEDGAEVYIRKVVVCRTELVSENTFNTAFVNFDEPYSRYNDFQRVEDIAYNLTWSAEEMGTGNTYTVEKVNGRTAITAPGGYLYLDVADDFAKHNGKDVADLAISITYWDGEGTVQFSYNSIEENFDYSQNFPMTNTGEWVTTTVYVDNAKLANAGNDRDLRINLGDTAIAAVQIAIGADKTALKEFIDKVINTAGFTADSVAAYNMAKNAAQAVYDNTYATKAEVEAALAGLQATYDALVTNSDPRYTLMGASWDKDSCSGEITLHEGWYAFRYNRGHWQWFGIGDPEGILKDATSVTYEYEVYFDTTDATDRCFLDFGDTIKWHEVEEGSAQYDEDGFLSKGNGFTAGGTWNATPKAGEWGTIRIKNDHYDPNQTKNGCITALHGFFQQGDLYIRSVKVYDNNDESKYVQLRFHEDVNDLQLTAGSDGVEQTTKEGYGAWVIPSDWKSLNIDLNALLASGTVTKDTKRFAVKLEYWLEKSDNADELLMVKHYNPNGTGNNSNKAEECEHQLGHEELTKRGKWVQHTFILDDALFDVDNKKLNITYGNGNAIYIRGVQVYEVDEDGNHIGEKPASWGVLEAGSITDLDHPTYDWETEFGYQISAIFGEGTKPTEFVEDNGRRCALMYDDYLYVNVDDTAVTANDHYIRIDITHQNGCSLHVEYNMLTPEGVDVSTEPNLSYYLFHASNGLHIIDEYGNNAGQSSSEFSDALGVVRSISNDHNDWMTTSIYLKDAQFRNQANGYDFRVRAQNGAVISRIEVIVIDEGEYNTAESALGDRTELKALLAQIVQQYPDESDIPDDLWDAYDEARNFAEGFGYRANQETVDAMTRNLIDALPLDGELGDVDGDGSITSTDARLTLQFYAGKIAEHDLDISVADVDGDDEITSTDARLILQYYAGKIDGFPAE